MKKILIAVALAIAMPTLSHADTWQENCDRIAELAQAIMGARQEGVAMSRLMKAPGMNETLENIIIEAFDTARYQTPAIRTRTIEEFRDRWYLRCAKELRGKPDTP